MCKYLKKQNDFQFPFKIIYFVEKDRLIVITNYPLKKDIEEIIKRPNQIVPGDGEDLIAQSKYKNGLMRVPFIEINGSRKILTLYHTSKIEKYWRNA